MRILITGTSTGIGRALTERLLPAGHEIWGLARSDQSAWASTRTSFHPLRCDVGSLAEIRAAAGAVSAATDHLDAVITCAGIHGEVGRALTADPVHWAATVQANLGGTVQVLQAFHPLLARATRRAKIVCFSGGGATSPRANFSAYGAAKTAIVRLVETIALEERARPLDINAVAPGAINTRLTDEVIALGAAVVGEAEHQAALKQKQTGGASLDRALGLVEWLLAPASDGVSGRLFSAPWDPWPLSPAQITTLAGTDHYQLRRVTPPSP